MRLYVTLTQAVDLIPYYWKYQAESAYLQHGIGFKFLFIRINFEYKKK